MLNTKCTTGQNGAGPKSLATPRSRDLLVNKQAMTAFRNGKIRESIAFDFEHGYR